MTLPVTDRGANLRTLSQTLGCWVRPACCATLLISCTAARPMHIRTGRAATVVIGRGTVSRIKNGPVNLPHAASRLTAAKLKHLGHVTLTLRPALVAAGGAHLTIDAAGRY